MNFNRKLYSDDLLKSLYSGLLKPRLIEEKMLILLRQNEISKWFSGIGQEAIAVGSAMAMEKDEYILPLHRNLGIFTSREVPLFRLFSQFQGKLSGYTKGRDRSFHFGTKEHHIVGMISHLGPQLAVADGIALADLLENKNKATLVFSGDGGTSEGDFHEALNVAAVWNLPVIFMIENNGYGLSTPNNEQFRFKSFTDKGPAYGIDALQIDGNNILEVYDAVKKATASIRSKPRPILIEALTFRMRGHEEASGTKYVPQELFEKWSQKDPVENYEKYLLEQNVLTYSELQEVRKEIKKEIDEAWAQVAKAPTASADTAVELSDVYAPFDQVVIKPSSEKKVKRRYVDAISDSIRESMEKYPKLVLMGQDVAEYGGVFKVTEGLVEKFGKKRIINTPLCESAILGTGLGLSINDYKAIIEMQFADFVTSGFNQIVNNFAKIHYRWGQNADVVVRMPTGAGTAAGPFHSQSNEAWFVHTPGLKVVFPSSPHDAKGLLNASIEDPNPVLFFEHKFLYRSVSEEIPESYYTEPIGKARMVTEGNDISIITYGLPVIWAKEIVANLGNYTADLIDLRTLLPWDKETVENSVKKTGRAIVITEDTLTGSIASEIAAYIGEKCFQYLDAPVVRVGSLDTPVPFSPALEENFLPKKRMKEKIEELLLY
ncbi:MAG: dehydrogenase E1 component subunit alpha/beta [Sporocytophaga sp.]|uniref:alpha-ketoacid dehydrogenase subunit alpha/beta n=1 Tax=Sporocytophaga sp. TaxID=2231183 RepID=UPI001B0A05ED|nr:dehydrogenase E1 component subunit alpha/beta [Sporocytophaga sp.]MBO9699733.1 dehydrogenase E1 component subunit alpha/beta [Sporocytophaga sp.]